MRLARKGNKEFEGTICRSLRSPQNVGDDTSPLQRQTLKGLPEYAGLSRPT